MTTLSKEILKEQVRGWGFMLAILLFSLAAGVFTGGCSTAQAPRDLRADCDIASAVQAGFAPILQEKCDAGKEEYCLGLAAARAAIAVCYARAEANDRAGVEAALAAVREAKP